ncbi:MAG: SAM-dependent methyltransferase [Aquisalimonadaceae bacterium]
MTPPDPDPGQLPADWPAPSDDAMEHCRRLARRLGERITANDGWISFHDWMEAALYAPGLGYYSAGARRFGPAGDFITAPVISSLFGWTLARQCAQVLADCGGDTILEFGPGDGDLAVDVLQELQRMDALPARYLLLERSGTLRARQQERLQDLPVDIASRVQWLDRLPETPIRGVMLANEVADALPVQRFHRTADGVAELGVTLEKNRFAWAEQPADTALTDSIAALEGDLGRALPADYISEFSPQLAGWMGALADALEAGVALIVDYGYPRPDYYLPERREGTLMCHYRHRAHGDALLLPGLQDITAFVDFTLAAEGAFAAGLEVVGYTSQAHFLMGAGLPEVLQTHAEIGTLEQVRLAQQAKTLMMPGEMGERFQVLAVGRELPGQLSGFSLYNYLHRL